MNDSFLFRTLPISEDVFNSITREIREYHLFIKSSNLESAGSSHETVYNVHVNHMMIRCPILLKYLVSLTRSRIYGIKFNYAFPEEKQIPHIDYVTKDYQLATESYLALNFPVENCDSTRVYFCEPVGEICHEFRYSGEGYRAKVGIHDDWNILAEYYLTQPTIINTNVYHNIENFTDRIRISLSIRFEKNPWHLL